MNTNGTAYARITNGTTYAISSPDALVNNAWNYLALTYDGSTLRLYLLNSNHPTLTLIGSVTPNVTLPSTLTYLYVATAGSTNTVLYDDIRISNAVLSDAQLGYHGSFTGGAGPQMLQSTVAPDTATPTSGALSPTTTSPQLSTTDAPASPQLSLQPAVDAGIPITATPIETQQVDSSSPFTTTARHFKQGAHGKPELLSDERPDGVLD
jgi:hypothetical protein